MTQDPSDRAPSDPTAAPPDSASTPPQSWSAPDAPSSEATPPDSTRDSPSDATSAAGAPDPAPGSAGESTQVIDTSAARPYAGYDPGRFAGSPATGQAAPGPVSGYSAPPAGNHRAPGAGEHGSPYGAPPPGAPGYGPPGYAAPSYGQQAEAAAYGNVGGQPGPPGPGPGYPPPGYGGTGYGYTASAYGPPPTNTMAILSLIFAFVFAPVGIVLGFIARRQIRETGEQGDGIALAGLIISIAFTALFVLLVVIPILFLIFAAGAGGLS